MGIVVYSSPFVPAEWIAAHGHRPCRLLPRSLRDGRPLVVPAGVCPYANAFVREALDFDGASAVVVTTACDQMRRAADVLERPSPGDAGSFSVPKRQKTVAQGSSSGLGLPTAAPVRSAAIPVFLMNVPSTWRTQSARDLYRSELERLGRFLKRVGGHAPSDRELTECMIAYDDGRASLQASRTSRSARRYSQAIADFCAGGGFAQTHMSVTPVARGASPPESVPLALLGGPLFREDFDIFDVIEEAGGQIVLDASETGERTLPALMDHEAVRRRPLDELARAYFDTIPDPFRRPNAGLYEWLRRELPGRGVRGILLRHCLWCDTWAAEAHRLKGSFGLPVLELDVYGQDAGSRSRISGRLQAFVEMLS
jgi:hypothetical protein